MILYIVSLPIANELLAPPALLVIVFLLLFETGLAIKMTLRTRKILFYILVLIFLIAGTGSILYGQGLRINLRELALQKTGAIFVQSAPKDTAIFMNGTPIKNQSGLLQGGTLINGLLPARYTVLIEKEHYSPWTKNIAVEPELVTKYEHIILVPQKEAQSVDQKTTRVASGDVRIIYDRNKGAYFILGISAEKINISLLFNQLKQHMLLLPGIVPIKDILVRPYDEKFLAIATENALYILDVGQPALQKISSEAPRNIAINNQRIVWSNKSNEIALYDFSGGKKTIVHPALPGINQKIGTTPSGNKIGILQSNGELYFLDPTTIKLSRFSRAVKNFEFSPDEQKIAVVGIDDEFAVYDLSKEKIKRFSLPLKEPVLHIVWHKDSEHLFVIYENKIYFTEIDDVLPLNAYPVAHNISLIPSPARDIFELNTHTTSNALDKNKSVAYSAQNDTLYFLARNQLYQFDFTEKQ